MAFEFRSPSLSFPGPRNPLIAPDSPWGNSSGFTGVGSGRGLIHKSTKSTIPRIKFSAAELSSAPVSKFQYALGIGFEILNISFQKKGIIYFTSLPSFSPLFWPLSVRRPKSDSTYFPFLKLQYFSATYKPNIYSVGRVRSFCTYQIGVSEPLAD